jgi:membrane protein required for colicin V production
MTYYDAVMAGLVVAGMVWGAWRGITWQVASIASLVLGYSVSHTASGQLAPQLPGEPVVARALAMLIIYVAVSGGVFFAAWLVRTTLRKLQFEAFDRHLGMVLGGMEGALLGMVGTLFVVSLAPQVRGPIFASPTGKVVGQVMDTLGPVLPSEARTVLAPHWNGTADSPLAGDSAEPRDDAPIAESRPARDTATRDSDSPDATAPSPAPAATSLGDLIEREEKRVGQAIVETAEKELQSIGTGNANDRAVERR